MKGYDVTKPVEYKELLRELLKTPSMKRDASYIRLNYIRYADDFVIGVEGSYTIAKQVLQKTEAFINNELKLKFNPDKTSISKFMDQSFNFLGYNIKTPMSNKGVKPFESIILNNKSILRRKKVRPIIEMDTIKVLTKLKNNGFIQKRVSHSKHHELQYRGTFKGNLINLDHPDILKYYNSVLRGIQNYYSISRNRVALARIG